MEQTEEDHEEEEAFSCEINKLSIQLIIGFKKTELKWFIFYFDQTINMLQELQHFDYNWFFSPAD